MCSIGEEEFGDEGGAHSMPVELSESFQLDESVLAGSCPKCSAEEVVVQLRSKEPECKTCFLSYVRHKFRASLGSSKLLPKNADVVVIFNGNPASVTLLDMIHYAQTQNTFKRLHCSFQVLFIDDSFLGQQPEYVEGVLKLLQRYNDIDSFYISLASNGHPMPMSAEKMTEIRSKSAELEHSLKRVVAGMKSLTSQQDFIANLNKNVMRSAANYLNSQFVFLPDISADLATDFLTNISLGRGASTAHDVALVDSRIENLTLVRPVKDLTELEVRYYIKLNNLPAVHRNPYGNSSDSMASIQNLTKSFVENLQKKFPSTVSTVFRTGNKITTKSQLSGKIATTENSPALKCKLCHSEIDCNESKTLFAVEFSRVVSEFAGRGLADTDSLEKNARDRLHDDAFKEFCHACRTILRDSMDSTDLKTFF